MQIPGADGAVSPTGGCANPTLTIGALARQGQGQRRTFARAGEAVITGGGR
jgi:hypothetical protein